MAGLLGESIDDPRTMAMFAGIQGLLSGRGLAQGISSGLLNYGGQMQQAKQQAAMEEERKQRAAMQALQMQQQQMMLEQAKQAQAKQAAVEAAYRGAIRSPDQMAMGANGGPTLAAANAAPNAAPGIDQQALIRGLTQADPMAAFQMLQPEKPDYKVVGNSLVQIGKGGVKEAYRPPEKPDLNSLIVMGPDGKPTLNQMLLDAKRQIARDGASSQSVSFGSPVAGVDASGKPVFFQPSKNGGAPAIVPGVSPEKKDKPLTESQAKAAAFASQMKAGEEAFLTSGLDGTKLGDQVGIKVAQGAGNFLTSDAAQKARQAQEQWAEAYLRFKTGAAATEGEVSRNVRTFFPQPGERGPVVEQKARQRQQAMHDVRIAAGGAPIETVTQSGQSKQVVRTGTLNGRKVVQYADGTTNYAD